MNLRDEIRKSPSIVLSCFVRIAFLGFSDPSSEGIIVTNPCGRSTRIYNPKLFVFARKIMSFDRFE